MGLLDQFTGLFDGSDAHQNVGLGLLSAAAGILANNRGLNAGLPALGMGMQQGIQGYAQAQDGLFKRQQMDMQSKLYGAETDYKKAQLEQLNRQSGIMKMLLGDQGGSTQEAAPANFSPSFQSAPPTSFGTGNLTLKPGSFIGTPEPQPEPKSSGNPYVPGGTGMFSPDKFSLYAALKMAGGPDLSEYFKIANTPQEIKAGSWQRNPLTGEMTYAQKPESGMYFDSATKTFRPYAGFAESQATIEGAKTAATERAKNRYTFQEYVGPDGKTYSIPTTAASDNYYGTGNTSGIFLNGGSPGGAPSQQRAPVSGDTLHQAVQIVESGGNPNAVSPKGAVSTYQVMPSTATNPGFGITPARDNSPAELARVGREYLAVLTKKYGETLGLAAYNMGPGAFDKWLAGGGDWNKLPLETRDYIGKVHTKKALLEQNGQGGQAQQTGTPVVTQSSPAIPNGPLVKANPAATAYAQGAAESAVKYGEDLTSRVSEGERLLHTVEEQVNLASQFRMGGGAETRMKVAQYAQALGLPQATVDGIAGGDLGAMKAFQKATVNQSVEAVRQSIGNNRMNQAEFRQFTMANPNISDDPRGLEKVYDFYNRMHQRNVRELDERDQYLQGGGDPARWSVEWARRNMNSGKTPPVGRGPAPAADRQSQQQQPAIVRRGTHNGHSVIQYSDGRIEYEGTR
jgi:hypothetical protein